MVDATQGSVSVPRSLPSGSDLQTLIYTLQNAVVAINAVTQQLAKTTTLFPLAAQTSATASTGANGAPPAQVAGYLVTQLGAFTVKFPYYLS